MFFRKQCRIDKKCCRFDNISCRFDIFQQKKPNRQQMLSIRQNFLSILVFVMVFRKQCRIDKKCCRFDNISCRFDIFQHKKPNRQQMLSIRQHFLSILVVSWFFGNNVESTRNVVDSTTFLVDFRPDKSTTFNTSKMQNRHENTHFRHVFGISTLIFDKFRHVTTKSQEMTSFFFHCEFMFFIFSALIASFVIFSFCSRRSPGRQEILSK